MARLIKIMVFILFKELSLFASLHKAVFDYEKFKNDKVVFIYDTWKYHFGWQTLGGGYIRHFLIFTENEHLIIIKTNDVSKIPGYYNIDYFDVDRLDEIKNWERVISYSFGKLLNEIFKTIFGSIEDPRKDEIKKLINETSTNPCVENVVRAFLSMFKESKVIGIYEIDKLKEVKIKKKFNNNVYLSFRYNEEKHDYVTTSNKWKRIIIILRKFFKIENSNNEIKTDNIYDNIYEYSEPKDENKRNIFLELGGLGGFFSINYEKMLKEVVGLRVGAGLFAFALTSPITINIITNPKSNHHIEIGGGIIIFLVGERSAITSTLNIGYRYQPKKAGVLLKLIYSPIFSKDDLFNWFGLGIGYTY